MDHIFRGEPISRDELADRLKALPDVLQADLGREPPGPEVVIEAAHALSLHIDREQTVERLQSLGVPRWAAADYMAAALAGLSRTALRDRVRTELGEDPFRWRMTAGGFLQKHHPLGVMLHIGAGNALGLSAFSVIEGLLTGNINILKLPGNEGGLSGELLLRLMDIEPRLKPYVYVLDVSSGDSAAIAALLAEADAAVVWGSDEAVAAVRRMAPPALPLIEWGHRLSFAYFAPGPREDEDLAGLARDICLTDQLYCSAPQCVFYETGDRDRLRDFAGRLAEHMDETSRQYPPAGRPLNAEAQITWTRELVRMEQILGEKELITGDDGRCAVMVDFVPALKASPLFRNIWVMPIRRDRLPELLRPHKGHLQTVGLSCADEDAVEISDLCYRAGVCRVTPCGEMSAVRPGEPHDGAYPLGRYVRRITRREKPAAKDEASLPAEVSRA